MIAVAWMSAFIFATPQLFIFKQVEQSPANHLYQ